MQLSFKLVKKTIDTVTYICLHNYLSQWSLFLLVLSYPLVSFLFSLKSFSISCKADVLAIVSLRLSGNVLLSHSVFKTDFAGYRILS